MYRFALFCLQRLTVLMEKKTAKIVVVGAGIAGLTAAHTLRRNGFNEVVVLEGSDRIGGRIHTEAYGKNTRVPETHVDAQLL